MLLQKHFVILHLLVEFAGGYFKSRMLNYHNPKRDFFSALTIKEGSTSHPDPLSSGAREETALLGARNRYAIRLTGHQSPRQIVRDGTAGGQLAITCWLRPPFLFLIAVSLCTCRHSNEEFILKFHRFHRFTQISSLQATIRM